MKKQNKYHVFKDSLINKWIENNSFVSKKSNFSNKLIKFDLGGNALEIKHSNLENFYINYEDDNELKKHMDDLEKILNRKNGVEEQIDKLRKYFSSDMPCDSIQKISSKKIYDILHFWRERWETIVEEQYILLQSSDGKSEQILKQKDSIFTHLDSQFCSLYKMGFISDKELPSWFDKNDLTDKIVENRQKWKFDINNSNIYIFKSKNEFPLFQNPIFLTKIDEENVFYFQLDPNSIILIISKFGKLENIIKKELFLDLYLNLITIMSLSSYSFYVSTSLFKKIDLNNDDEIDWTTLLISWYNFKKDRIKINRMFLNKNTKNKNLFIFNFTMMICIFRKKIKEENLSSKNILPKYLTDQKSIIIIMFDEFDEIENKINNISSEASIKEICVSEMRKKDKNYPEKDLQKILSYFNFQNK